MIQLAACGLQGGSALPLFSCLEGQKKFSTLREVQALMPSPVLTESQTEGQGC